MLHEDDLGGLIVAALFIALTFFPVWRILAKTGQSRALVLLLLVPLLGPVLLALLFGFGRWPRYPGV